MRFRNVQEKLENVILLILLFSRSCGVDNITVQVLCTSKKAFFLTLLYLLSYKNGAEYFLRDLSYVFITFFFRLFYLSLIFIGQRFHKRVFAKNEYKILFLKKGFHPNLLDFPLHCVIFSELSKKLALELRS